MARNSVLDEDGVPYLPFDFSVPFHQQFLYLDQIGRGTFSTVYRAVHVPSNIPVAIKRMEISEDLPWSYIDRELSTLKQLVSPYVVRYYGSLVENNLVWIAMEFCGFGTLRDVISLMDNPFKEELISTIADRVLRGLVALHSINKIHRDLKTDNILVTSEGIPKLADLGLVRNVDNKRNTLVGTPLFIAPEMIMASEYSEEGYNEKVDIWALGISMIEVAERRDPWEGILNNDTLLYLPTYSSPKLIGNWSAEFTDFVNECLIKKMKDRPSAEKLLRHRFVTKHRRYGTEILRNFAAEVNQVLEHSFVRDENADNNLIQQWRQLQERQQELAEISQMSQSRRGTLEAAAYYTGNEWIAADDKMALRNRHLQAVHKARADMSKGNNTLEQDLSNERILEIFYRFRSGVPIGDKIFMFKKFKNVFRGDEALNWLEREERLPKKDAKRVAALFLKKKLIGHLSSNLLPFTEACFYRCNNAFDLSEVDI